MTEETFEYLRDCTFMMRDDADCQDDTNEGKQIASELKMLVNVIELAVDLSIGKGTMPDSGYLQFCSRSISTRIDDLKKKFNDMTWNEKVEDKGDILREIHHMVEVNKIFLDIARRQR